MDATARCCAKGCTISHPVGSVHRCSGCDGYMHAFCGEHDGEGFGSNSLMYCLSSDMCMPPEYIPEPDSADCTQADKVEITQDTHVLSESSESTSQASTTTDAQHTATTIQGDTSIQPTPMQKKSRSDKASSIMINKLNNTKKTTYKQTVLSKVKALPTPRVNLTNKNKGIIVRKIKQAGYGFDKPWKINYRNDLVKEAVQAAHISFGVSTRTIRRFMESGEQVLEQSNEVFAKKKCRERKGTHHAFEKQLIEWVGKVREAGFGVTQGLIVSKGREYLGENATLELSNGWFQGFVKRWSLANLRLHGEAGDTVKSSEENEAIMKEIRIHLAEYDLDHIYNMDETGLFYKLLPNRTYITANEVKRTTRGSKAMKQKDRVTLIMCTNADGSHKIPIAMIGTSKKPRCFTNNSPCPLPYMHQKNA